MATTLLDEFQSAPDLEAESTVSEGRTSVDFDEQPNDGLGVTLRKPNGYSRTLVSNYSYWTRYAHRRFAAEERLPDGPWMNPAYKLRRLLLLDVARTHNADLFITDDKFLLEICDIEIQGTNVVSTLDGIAIIGAHLRNRRVFIYKSSPDGSSTAGLAGNSFYIACRRAIQDLSHIPYSHLDDRIEKHSSGRMFYSIALHGNPLDRIPKPARAFNAIAPRTEQLLRTRDNAILALLQPHSTDAFDDALFALDMFMLVLGSIFDSLAQVTDAILDLKSGVRFPSWREDRWFKALQAKDIAVGRLVKPGTKNCYMLQLHASLRNVIHGSIHQAVVLTNNSLPPEGFIVIPVIPTSEYRLVRRAVRELGGPERFGATEQDGELWLRPGPTIETFLDEGMSFVKTVLVALAQKLPSEELTHIPGSPEADDIALRCAYLAGITSVATFRFQR